LVEKGDQQKVGQKGTIKGEYDESILYTYMKMSQ
jgi:hypothetical protein